MLFFNAWDVYYQVISMYNTTHSIYIFQIYQVYDKPMIYKFNKNHMIVRYQKFTLALPKNQNGIGVSIWIIVSIAD